MPEITSVQNAHVKYLHRLYQKSRLRRTDGKFIIDNPKIIYHLLERPAPSLRLTELFHTAKYAEASGGDLPSGGLPGDGLPDGRTDSFPAQNEPPATSVTAAVLEKITGQPDNPGLIALAEFDASAMFTEAPPPGSILVLDHLQDPGNVGTLIRSAHGAGLKHICFVGTSVDVLNPKVIRSSMGSFAYLTYSIINPGQAGLLKAERIVAGADRAGAVPYSSWPERPDSRPPEPEPESKSTPARAPSAPAQSGRTIALCIGSEAAGLCAEVQQVCDVKLEIPLSPDCESLNAAAAGAILLFHLFGQHRRD